MSDSNYRSARGEINRLPCIFEKAILRHCAVCQLAANELIVERLKISCTSPLARAECGLLAGLLREKSLFALKLVGPRRALTPAQQSRVQCGGLEGVKRHVDPQAAAPDVHKLIRLAKVRYQDLDDLPFSEIIQSVAAFRPHKRYRKPPDSGS